jgi:hypothetical protein
MKVAVVVVRGKGKMRQAKEVREPRRIRHLRGARTTKRAQMIVQEREARWQRRSS